MQTPPSPARPFQLEFGQVHVWLTRQDSDWTARDIARMGQCLSKDERERGARYRQEPDARAHVITRAMVRTLLSAYDGRPPEEWRFEVGEHGKPRLATGLDSRLRFNVSHCSGRIACALALDVEVGVDVEDAERQVEVSRLSNRFFSAHEAQTLAQLPVEEQQRRFFTYWTLKEAYIKVIGLGLAMPLEQFSFHLERGCPPRISFAPGRDEDPSRWRFREQRLDHRHHLAVAVESVDAGPAEGPWLERMAFQPADWLPKGLPG